MGAWTTVQADVTGATGEHDVFFVFAAPDGAAADADLVEVDNWAFAAAPAETLDLVVSTGSRCVAGKVQLVVSVRNADAVAAEATIETPFGEKKVTLAAGATSSSSFATRSSALAAAEVQVTGAAGDLAYSGATAYLARSCG